KATNAMTLAFDREGRLLAGTESPGRVFRIDATGKAFVLLDSSYNEIRALRVDGDGNIYVAAVSGRPPGAPDRAPAPASAPEPTPAAPGLTPNVTTEITVVAVADSAPQPAPSIGGGQSRSGPTAGAIYRILPDGAWDQIWESREDIPFDVAFEPGG